MTKQMYEQAINQSGVKMVMTDLRKLPATEKERYRNSFNRYFKMLENNDEHLSNRVLKTQKIDEELMPYRIIHELTKRTDYNVFHEIFKLNKKDINSLKAIPVKKTYNKKIKRDLVDFWKTLREARKKLRKKNENRHT